MVHNLARCLVVNSIYIHIIIYTALPTTQQIQLKNERLKVRIGIFVFWKFESLKLKKMKRAMFKFESLKLHKLNRNILKFGASMALVVGLFVRPSVLICSSVRPSVCSSVRCYSQRCLAVGAKFMKQIQPSEAKLATQDSSSAFGAHSWKLRRARSARTCVPFATNGTHTLGKKVEGIINTATPPPPY